MAIDDPITRFQDFFKSGLNEKGKPIYWEELKALSSRGDVSLMVDFKDLQRFDPALCVVSMDVLHTTKSKISTFILSCDQHFQFIHILNHVRTKNFLTS